MKGKMFTGMLIVLFLSNIVVAQAVTWVSIDVKPGSCPNAVNLESKGVLSVAILTTDNFDALEVDPVTVQFEGATPLRWAMEDVDGDGDIDLVFKFKVKETNLNDLSLDVYLSGETYGGIEIMGWDQVKIVP